MTPFDAETAAARAAQVPWAALPLRQRLKPVRELRSLLVERRDALTAAIEADVRRPPAEVIATDVMPCAAACKYLLTDAARVLKPRRAGRTPLWLAGSQHLVVRRPHGVVGVVGTWNYPLFLNLVPVLHALVAGNAVLWKPSENTPRFAEAFADLFAAAGFPPRLLQPLPTTRDAGPRLAESGIDFLHFTGSEAVGRKLAARLGERLIPSVLELSGCDAFVVMPDADVKLAARAAWYSLTVNRGQTCLAVRRLLVHADVRDRFVEELRPQADRSGPMRLLQSPQVEQANRLLAEAAAAGCEVLTAPGAAAGGEFTPAVALDAPPPLGLHREATFAPLAALATFRTTDDLLALDAACPYALGCSIFGTADFLPRLRPGLVCVNDVLAAAAHPATPLTGRGAAGWGPTQGDEGLLAMTVPQTVATRPGTFRPHVDAGLQPLPGDAGLLTGMLRLTHGRDWRDRAGGLRQMLRGVWAVRKR